MKRLKQVLTTLLLASLFALSGCGMVSVDNNDPSGTLVNEDAQYLVKFLNYDESTLYSAYVVEGGYADYLGPKPKKPSTDLFDYEFTGWDKDYKTLKITANTNFTAQFKEATIVRYHVSFVNYDGTILYETEVKAGEPAVYQGATPTRPKGEDGTTYRFEGWNRDTSAVNADTVFIAQYSSEKAKLAVRFTNYDASLLDMQYVEYGGTASYTGETPKRPDSGRYSYAFKGWDKPFEAIYEDTTYLAEYDEKEREFLVRFFNFEGEVIYETKTSYGGSVTFVGDEPQRPFEGRHAYRFSGWSKDTSNVKSNLDVHPVYETLQREGTPQLAYNYRSEWRNNQYEEYHAVSGCDSLNEPTDVYVPMTSEITVDNVSTTRPVRTIASNAFSDRANVRSVFLEDNIRRIEYAAFRSCSSLTEIRLSPNLEYIDNEAFNYCRNLEELHLPASLKEINGNPFRGIKPGRKITIDNKNKNFAISGSCLYTKNMKKLIALMDYDIEELVIPEGVEEIGSSAATNSNIKKLVLPSTLKVIGDNAFSNSYNLQSVDFQSASCILMNSAFNSSGSLREINNYENVTSLGGWAFAYTGLTSFTLYPALTNIETSSFTGCSQLKSVLSEGENVHFALYKGTLFTADYRELKCIFPETTKEIALHANTDTVDWGSLGDTLSWRQVTFSVDPENQTFASYGGSIFSKDLTKLFMLNRTVTAMTKDTFPAALTTIGSRSCMHLENLVSVDLSGFETITLEESAIYNSNSLKTVILPATTFTGSNTFSYCYGLESVTIGEGATSLPQNAFRGCNTLKTVSLPSTLVSIGNWAFGECNSLKFLELPAGLTTVENGAFVNTYDLILLLHCKTTGFQTGWSDSAFNLKPFYVGEKSEWENPPANIYFFSANPPTDDGLYWHYVNDKPEAWPVQNSGN